MYLNHLCQLDSSIFTVIVLLECSVIHYKGLVDEVSNLFSLLNIALIIWALMRENLSSGIANNTGADQPAHPRSLISAFVICILESIICRHVSSEISIF